MKAKRGTGQHGQFGGIKPVEMQPTQPNIGPWIVLVLHGNVAGFPAKRMIEEIHTLARKKSSISSATMQAP